MRIAYDGYVYTCPMPGGVSRYFANVIRRLPEEFTPVVTAPGWPPIPEPTHPRREVHVAEFPRIRACHRGAARWLQRRRFRGVYRNLSVDILHPTYYELLSREPFQSLRRPVVLTVYDMIHERYPALADPRGRVAAMKRAAITAADAVLCISAHTKSDLLDFYRLDESRIHVIPLAADIEPPAAGAAAGAPERPSFLHVGGRSGYKNFAVLLRALRNVVARRPDVRLDVVGAPFSPAETTEIAGLGLDAHVNHCGAVADSELALLYRRSVALVYPSLYEGFGIPPLEAMRCGTPVVASDTSSIPEVVGDAGILFQPHAVDDLTDILRDLLENPDRRAALVERGFARERIFRWEDTVARTVAVYRLLGQQAARRAA